MSYEWEETKPVHPYDPVFLHVDRQSSYTTEECLRILAASGFADPVFTTRGGNGFEHRRCWVTGPDGERHLADAALALIFKAERLERLCQDRGDAVLGMMERCRREL